MFGHARMWQGWASACGRNQERSAGAHASQGGNNQCHRRTFTVSGFAQSKPNSRGRKVQHTTFFGFVVVGFFGFFLSFAGGGTPSSCRVRVLLGPPHSSPQTPGHCPPQYRRGSGTGRRRHRGDGKVSPSRTAPRGRAPGRGSPRGSAQRRAPAGGGHRSRSRGREGGRAGHSPDPARNVLSLQTIKKYSKAQIFQRKRHFKNVL